MNWKRMPEGKEKYAAYLCSREWSVLKEAVKERSEGVCERCTVNKMDHVHHLTYARKYSEGIEDLQACCKQCHDFIHAKSHRDPSRDRPIVLPWCKTRVKTFYLAGKITGTDWRSDIVCGWSEENHSHTYYQAYMDYADCKTWAIVPSAASALEVDLNYSGPWWRDGFCHGVSTQSESPHGYGSPNGYGGDHDNEEEGKLSVRTEIASSVYEAIFHCDLLFAWIDCGTCYGTMFEIGFAKGQRKAVVVALSDEFAATATADEMWLLTQGSYSVTAASAKEAWLMFWQLVQAESKE